MHYSQQQERAIEIALNNPMSVITGGPGVGKSYTMRGICDAYEERYPSRKIYLCSPTGKAAKRMEESTGREASTIHRLLKYNPFKGGFLYSYLDPLPGPALLIIDEISMMGQDLARCLFSAIGEKFATVLVGDPAQLPSVSAGSVLRDIIRSGVVPVTALKYNYRQAEGSVVARIANEIVDKGDMQAPELKQEGDFFPVIVKDDKEAEILILDWVKENNEKVGLENYQVLSPMRKGHTGVENLNEKIRDIVNPEKEGEPILGGFRAGDKIMVTANDYKKMVFNGDIGTVQGVTGKQVIATIEGHSEEVVFPKEDLGSLCLSYAITIHKSQGSEFGTVLLAMTSRHYIMLKRNLLYTGMTRAKDRLILLTDRRAFKQAVRDNRVEKRYSGLEERLKEGGKND